MVSWVLSGSSPTITPAATHAKNCCAICRAERKKCMGTDLEIQQILRMVEPPFLVVILSYPRSYSSPSRCRSETEWANKDSFRREHGLGLQSQTPDTDTYSCTSSAQTGLLLPTRPGCMPQLTMTQFLPTCTYDPTLEALMIVSSPMITLSPICSG